jgi:hypothetical protein
MRMGKPGWIRSEIVLQSFFGGLKDCETVLADNEVLGDLPLNCGGEAAFQVIADVTNGNVTGHDKAP